MTLFTHNGSKVELGTPVKPNLISAAVHSEKVQTVDDAEAQLVALDFPTWLPFAAQTYQISPNIEDYILVTTPICPSDLPNRNGIGFPLDELIKFGPPPLNRQAYKAWKGCPVHLEHKNEIHEEAYGVVLDTYLTKIEGYGNGKLWKVMGLLAIDKKKHPEIAAKILSGEYNTYSMGAYVDYFSCSYCKKPMVKTRTGLMDHCMHLNPKADLDWKAVTDKDGMHLVFRNAHGISPIEVSIVADPAWTTALSDTVLAMDGGGAE